MRWTPCLAFLAAKFSPLTKTPPREPGHPAVSALSELVLPLASPVLLFLLAARPLPRLLTPSLLWGHSVQRNPGRCTSITERGSPRGQHGPCVGHQPGSLERATQPAFPQQQREGSKGSLPCRTAGCRDVSEIVMLGLGFLQPSQLDLF